MIRLIVAHDQKLGIAKNGGQPWSIPDDEAYFSRQTKLYGGNVLMGSTTFKTLKAALPERTNFVLSSQTINAPNMHQVNDLSSFFKKYTAKGSDLWVIGGASVYQQVIKLGLADELYITLIDADFNCDQHFPSYDSFQLKSSSEKSNQNGFTFSYQVYAKQS